MAVERADMKDYKRAVVKAETLVSLLVGQKALPMVALLVSR